MQKWDYLCISVMKSYGMNYRANGQKMNDWKDLHLHEIMQRLGRNGYEFVGYDGDNYIFKRPLQEKVAPAAGITMLSS